MAKFHFFTEADLLNQQTLDQAYGPVDGNETTQYRVTSKFTVSSDAKAYAVCDGIVFVQPLNGNVNSDYVNLILKPTVSDLENGFTPVEYFIYRGLKKVNFIKAGVLVPYNDIDSTGLTNGIWDDATFFQAFDPNIVASEKAFGWDKVSLPDSTLLTEIFYEDNNDNQLHHISQGALIGYFEGAPTIEGGFEIILKDRLYLPNLEMLRAPENIITTSSAPGGSDIPGNEPIARMREREQILNFVDPAAYMMLFFEGGVHVRNKNSPSQNCVGFTNIYNVILKGVGNPNFLSHNTLYLDIRNENGYSLNYYKDNEGVIGDNDYGDHLQISFDGINFPSVEYYINHWPIFTLIPPPNNINDFNTVNLKFRNYYNPWPLIYLDYAYSLNSNMFNLIIGELKFKESFSLSPPINWSNLFHFVTPNLHNLPGDTQVCSIIKLINIRKYNSINTLPSTVIPRFHYLDNCFGPLIELPLLPSPFNSQWVTGLGKRYVNIFDSDDGAEVIAELSLRVSTDDVIFSLEVINHRIPLRLDNSSINEDLNSEVRGTGRSTSNNFTDKGYSDHFSRYDIEIKKKIILESLIQIPIIDFVEQG